MIESVDPIRVLHVDDEPGFAELAAEFLERESDRLSVETAGSADEALDRLRATAFDCVVSDYDMPGTDGIELLGTVREEWPDLPFVLYTGNGSEEIASEAITRGASDYLRKGNGASQYTVLANRVENLVTRHRAERAVDATQKRYQRLIEESTDVIIVLDADGTYQYLSPTAERMLGYDPETLIGEVAFEYVHEADRAETMERFSAMIEHPERRESVEFRFDHGDGRWVWFEARGRNLQADPVVDGIVVYARDITKRKRRERTLERIVERMGTLLDAASKEETAGRAIEVTEEALDPGIAGVHLSSDDGDRLELAAAVDDARAEFGVPSTYRRGSDDVASRVVWDVFESGEPSHIDDTRTVDALAAETPARSSVVYPLGDHGIFVVSRMEPNAFDEVDRDFVELVAQTLTTALDRVERESELRERNRQLERLHETGRALMQADTEPAVASQVVRAAEEILDFPITSVRYYDEAADGLVLVDATDALDEHVDTPTVYERGNTGPLWDAYESGAPAIHEDLRETDHSLAPDTPIRSLLIVPLGEHGTLSIGTTEIASFTERDVFLARLLGTAAELALSRIAYESELVRQRDELDRQNERLDRFASTLSHDLRTPLNVAAGRLELARETPDAEHFEAMARAHDRMESLIRDVLTLAREGTRVNATESMPLAPLAADCWEHVRTDAARLTVETDRTVQADETRLRRLLENLFRNAIEHGGPEVAVAVGDLPAGFYVADDGAGVSEADREAIFEFGYSTEPGGSGLGLHIVNQIADAHDWSVAVAESDAGGARFEIRTE